MFLLQKGRLMPGKQPLLLNHNFYRRKNMKVTKITAICCLLVLSSLFLAGCRKKAAAEKPAAGVQTTAAAEKPAAAVPAGVDIAKPIADIKAEAEKMNVDQLRAKAMDYKNAIVAKKAELEKLTAKLKEIPLAQQLGTEAKAIQADIASVNKAIAPLTERFQVYYNTLKEKGGNLAGLEI